MHGNHPFVGRTLELARLHEAFEAACDGETRIAAVTGEPGIGKTRLADEMERYAREWRALVLWGQAHETAPEAESARFRLFEALTATYRRLEECLRPSKGRRIAVHLRGRSR